MKCQVLIDWLTFSVKETDPNKVIQTYLGMDPALFQLLASDADANVSRIDIACDDREGYLDMDKIIAKARDNEVNSRMRRRNIHESLDGVNKAGATRSTSALPPPPSVSAFMTRPWSRGSPATGSVWSWSCAPRTPTPLWSR